MDKKYIEENEIEIKYLRKQLTDDELEAFEVYLMDNPDLIQGLELSQLMIDSDQNAIKTEGKSNLNFFKQLLSKISVSLVGSYSLGVITASAFAILFANNWSAKNRQSFTQVAYLSQTRSLVKNDDSIPIFAFSEQGFNSSSHDNLVLSLDIGLTAQGEYKLIIRGPLNERSEAKITDKIERMKSDAFGNITLVRPVKMFETGVYEVGIQRYGSEEEMLYKFKLQVGTE